MEEAQLNNFYAYFPQGFYRDQFIISRDAARAKIAGDIDRLIVETNFDIAKFLEISGKNKEATDTAFKLLNKGGSVTDTKPHLEEADKFAKLRDNMIEPIYRKMIALGYDGEMLKG